MSETGEHDISLRIDRMNCTCLAPREHPDPERLRWRADTVARGRLAPALAQLIGSVFDHADPTVWRIRSLDVDLVFDPAIVDDDDFGRAWSQRVLVGVGRVLAQGDDGDNVLRFESRADYLAHFAHDLARGAAWGGWQYIEFDILRSLPDPTAIAEIMTREPEHTAHVLLRLGELNGLARVLAVLSPHGAAKVVDVLLNQSPASDNLTRTVFDAVLEVWTRAGNQSPYDNAHNALRLWEAYRRQFSAQITDGDMLLAARALLSLADALRTPVGMTLTARESVLLIREQMRRDGDDRGSQAVQALIDAGSRDSGWLERTAEHIAPAVHKIQRASEYTILSTFIGAFTVLPALVMTGLDDIVSATTASTDDEQRATLAQGLRMMVLVKCLGAARASDAVLDEAVRFAAGAQDAPALRVMPRLSLEQREAGYAALHALTLLSPEESDSLTMQDAEREALSLTAWMNTLEDIKVEEWIETDVFTSILAHRALKRFARRLMGFENSSITYLQHNFLEGMGSAAIHEVEVVAQLPACPLAMMMRMAGMDHTTVDVPWLHPMGLRLISDE